MTMIKTKLLTSTIDKASKMIIINKSFMMHDNLHLYSMHFRYIANCSCILVVDALIIITFNMVSVLMSILASNLA